MNADAPGVRRKVVVAEVGSLTNWVHFWKALAAGPTVAHDGCIAYRRDGRPNHVDDLTSRSAVLTVAEERRLAW